MQSLRRHRHRPAQVFEPNPQLFGAADLLTAALHAQDAADQPLLITSATNVTVTNNLFDRVLCYPFSYGAAQVFVPTPQPPIFIAYASNLLIANNTYNIPANCTYGNWAQPIQTMNGTVTGLVTSP